MSETENRANETERPEPPPEKDAVTGRIVLVPVPPVALLRYAANLESILDVLTGVIVGMVIAVIIIALIFRR